jgi:N-ethylmaleimide reductase
VNIFDAAQFGDLQLHNRVVMAPLTRTRARQSGVPNELLVEHYAQRAGFGMIITEGTWPVQESRSYPGQPGIETEEQVAGWARVADAVHAAGGTIVMQVMHGGRASHTDITGTSRIVGPSALAAPGEARTPNGKSSYTVPHALTTEELPGVLEQIVTASRNAIRAGLDGVEVHSANGYLLHEFLSPVSNQRTDQYGGSPENRARFGIEVTTAVAEAIGAARTGIRLSPEHGNLGVVEDDHEDVLATYLALSEGLAPLGLAFVDVLHADLTGDLAQGIRRTIGAPFIGNSGFGTTTTRDEALGLVADDIADAVAVGRPAIANPDLVVRWQRGAEENEPNPATFYGPEGEGYIDYPALSADHATA